MPRLAPVGVDLPALFRQASYDGGIPVLYDPGKNKKLWLVMPYWREGSTWLQGEHSRHNHHYIRTGTSDPNHWEFPRLWLTDTVHRLLQKFGQCYHVQVFYHTQVCAPACWDAEGFICECSCVGENHGKGKPKGAHVISETFAITWKQRDLSCRLLKAKGAPVFYLYRCGGCNRRWEHMEYGARIKMRSKLLIACYRCGATDQQLLKEPSGVSIEQRSN
jgi:hypothetical protein